MDYANPPKVPPGFFPPCVWRSSNDFYVVACGNKEAGLYMKPCSKRCTQNVDPEDHAVFLQAEADKMVAKIKKLERERESEQFKEHLKRASAIVATWPAWKQNLLGRSNMSGGDYLTDQDVEEQDKVIEVIEAIAEGSGTPIEEVAEKLGLQARPQKVVGESPVVKDHLPTPEQAAKLGQVLERHNTEKGIKGPRTESLSVGDCSTETWRAYTWVCPRTGERHSHVIHNPVKVGFRKGGSTHRILDKSDVTHCVPAPGHFGCVLTWSGGIAW